MAHNFLRKSFSTDLKLLTGRSVDLRARATKSAPANAIDCGDPSSFSSAEPRSSSWSFLDPPPKQKTFPLSVNIKDL